jgi:endonuclease III
VSPARPNDPGGWRAPDRRKVRRVLQLLDERFGPLEPPRQSEPLEELVFTVLSQNTSDVNSGRAYAALRERFPDWEDVVTGPTRLVADAIRPGGLADTKAPRIQAILEEIRRREGNLDLSWMRRAPDAEVRGYLTALPGVGPKTAACVLAFSLGRPALPVDTHVFRVAGRLGWLPPRTTAAGAHGVLESLVPAPVRVAMHVGLIRLGREICRPGRPRCEVCPLRRLCPTAPLVLGRGTGRMVRSG